MQPNTEPAQITAVAVSGTKKWMAICKKGRESASCVVYDIENMKKKKTMNAGETSVKVIRDKAGAATGVIRLSSQRHL